VKKCHQSPNFCSYPNPNQITIKRKAITSNKKATADPKAKSELNSDVRSFLDMLNFYSENFVCLVETELALVLESVLYCGNDGKYILVFFLYLNPNKIYIYKIKNEI
jgi:hypothetical protein